MPKPSRSRIRRVTTMRSTAGSNPASTNYQRDPAYPDDPYAYQNGYDEEPAPKKRSSGLMTVAAVLALAVVGTGAAFAYRTYVGSPRSGEPPIIRADNSPTKVVPAQSDAGASKTPDRMPTGDGGEKLVSREEAPVDVNSRSGAPRVVFPPLNQNGNPPPVASVSPAGADACDGRERHAAEQRAAQDQDARGEGRRGRERRHPRRRHGVRQTGTGDTVRRGPCGRGASRPACCPGRAQPCLGQRQREYADVAGAAGGPTVRFRADPRGGDQSDPDGAGGQRRRLSGSGLLAEERGRRAGLLPGAAEQVPDVLGSKSPVIKRADLGEKGVYYRAMVGPFGSPDEASQFCGSLKTAGGQCVVQRN